MEFPYIEKDNNLECLREAIRSDNLQDVMRIIDKKAPEIIKRFSYALPDAFEWQHEHIIRYMTTNGVKLTSQAAIAAAKTGSTNMLSLLLDLGWDINMPLDLDAPALLGLVLEQPDLVRWLLNRGADPDAACRLNITPLSMAVQWSHLPVIQLLLDSRKEPKLDMKKGQLMYFAAIRESPDLELLKVLARAGTPVDQVPYQNKGSLNYRSMFKYGTPLWHACVEKRHEVARVLLDLGADPDMKCRQWGKRVGPTPKQLVDANSSREMLAVFEKHH